MGIPRRNRRRLYRTVERSYQYAERSPPVETHDRRVVEVKIPQHCTAWFCGAAFDDMTFKPIPSPQSTTFSLLSSVKPDRKPPERFRRHLSHPASPRPGIPSPTSDGGVRKSTVRTFLFGARPPVQPFFRLCLGSAYAVWSRA